MNILVHIYYIILYYIILYYIILYYILYYIILYIILYYIIVYYIIYILYYIILYYIYRGKEREREKIQSESQASVPGLVRLESIAVSCGRQLSMQHEHSRCDLDLSAPAWLGTPPSHVWKTMIQGIRRVCQTKRARVDKSLVLYHVDIQLNTSKAACSQLLNAGENVFASPTYVFTRVWDLLPRGFPPRLETCQVRSYVLSEQ